MIETLRVAQWWILKEHPFSGAHGQMCFLETFTVPFFFARGEFSILKMLLLICPVEFWDLLICFYMDTVIHPLLSYSKNTAYFHPSCRRECNIEYEIKLQNHRSFLSSCSVLEITLGIGVKQWLRFIILWVLGKTDT